MEYKVSPAIYAEQQRKKEDEYEHQKNNYLRNVVDEVENGYKAKTSKLNRAIDKSFGTYMSVMATGIIIACIFICIVIVNFAITKEVEGFGMKFLMCLLGIIGGAIGGGIWGLIATGVLGIGLFPIAYPIYRCVCNILMKKAEVRYLQLEEEKAIAIENIKKPILTEIAQHRRDTEYRITQYTEGFEKEAKNLSVNFANSTIAEEIAQWLSDDFLKKVKAANRASHIEKIIVSFDFDVAKVEIRSNIGIYSFEEHRCESLQDALMQAALSMAIASRVQTKMVMLYDKDESGSEYKIDVTYKYPEQTSSIYSYQHGDYVSACLVYTADNGYYKPIQKW